MNQSFEVIQTIFNQ